MPAPSRRRRTALLAAVAAPAAVSLIGCGQAGRLETGYKIRPLGSNLEQRRAFYADPYSREALQAEAAEAQGTQRTPSRVGGARR